jgi:hypothetical protein
MAGHECPQLEKKKIWSARAKKVKSEKRGDMFVLVWEELKDRL